MREYCAKIKEKRGFQKGAEANRYLHFGVREHAMAAILNGLTYHGCPTTIWLGVAPIWLTALEGFS